jgi:hypothetical protein
LEGCRPARASSHGAERWSRSGSGASQSPVRARKAHGCTQIYRNIFYTHGPHLRPGCFAPTAHLSGSDAGRGGQRIERGNVAGFEPPAPVAAARGGRGVYPGLIVQTQVVLYGDNSKAGNAGKGGADKGPVNFPGIVKPEAIQCRRSVEMSHSNFCFTG